MKKDNLELIPSGDPSLLEPLTCLHSPLDLEIAGATLQSLLLERWKRIAEQEKERPFFACSDYWPSGKLLESLSAVSGDFTLLVSGIPAAWRGGTANAPDLASAKILRPEDDDKHSFRIVYPWDILKINEEVLGSLRENSIRGTVRENVTIDGILLLGENSVLLPGVYLEGVVMIGKNCKIGPNCYIRGNTYIGDFCHVGQAVELKNSLLMNHVSAGHLTYLGDSIVCPRTNFGAGTIASNFRHDGKNHRSLVGEELLDTGRRKFGTIIGDNVHTGIHTSIYPGRKLWPDVQTLPGEVVRRDLRPPRNSSGRN